MLDTLALWLATYALHSTLLLASAWALARFFPAASERVWRLALFGGLVTATLHAGGYWPRVAYLELPGLARDPHETAHSVPHAVAGDHVRRDGAAITPVERQRAALGSTELTRATERQAPRPRRWIGGAPASRAAAGPERDASASSAPVRPSSATMASTTSGALESESATTASSLGAGDAEWRPTSWWPLVTIAWLVVLAASLVTIAARAARFRWHIRARRHAGGGEARSLLSELTRRAGFRRAVRLSVADGARVPMARGWLRPEICLPPALEDQLETEELEAALAHELAHLERRDPLWRAVTRLIATALPFQPLNRLACCALEDEAELRCDDRASALTGRPAALARCLTRVASWTAIDRGPSPLPALAARRGTLRRRVVRLLDERARSTPSRFLQAVAVVPPVAVLMLAPGLGAAPHRGPHDHHEAAAASVLVSIESPRPESAHGAAVEVASRSTLAAPVVHRLEVPTFGEPPPEPPVAPVAPASPRVPASPAALVELAAPVPLAAPAFAPTAPLAPLAPAALAALAPPVALAAAPQPAAAPAVATAPAAPAAPASPAAPAPPDDDDDPDADYDVDDDEDDDVDYDDEEEEAALEAQAERLEEVAEEVDRLMEDLDERIEAAMAMFDDAFAQELDAVAEEIDTQVESFDEEIERSLAPLEEALEELSEELEEATANGNERRAQMLERQMSDIGAAMGDLGGRLGALVSRSALTGVDQHLQALLAAQSETIETYASRQSEIGRQLVREIEERQRSGQRLDDAEIESLASELERIAEEAEPHYEELERQVEELTRQLEPARERMRTLSVELQREVAPWRKRHADLLRELEEDGVSVPSYDDEPGAAEPEAEPEPDEGPDGEAGIVY